MNESVFFTNLFILCSYFIHSPNARKKQDCWFSSTVFSLKVELDRNRSARSGYLK